MPLFLPISSAIYLTGFRKQRLSVTRPPPLPSPAIGSPAMEELLRPFLVALLLAVFSHFAGNEASAATVVLYNKCHHSVWPGIQPSAGQPILAGGGLKLSPKMAHSLVLPPLWSGRIWGRHGCSFDLSGRGKCDSGDCGGNFLCNGVGGEPPATLAEMTLTAEKDFYDVSLVDGYNLAISILPFKARDGGCGYAGCLSDLNPMCPEGLQVRSGDGGRVVGCKSACSAFQSPMYCCTGSYGTADTCKPTEYSKIFKAACPRAYSYAYDDASSLATCSGANYLVTFCPHHHQT